jgi:cyclopropane-fatty-acyl-phospholipid synthase
MTMSLADVFSLVVPAERGVAFRAYDGSSSGPSDAVVTLDVRNERAVDYFASSPNQLGIARAYVSGDLEIIGSAYDAVSRLWPIDLSHITTADKLAVGRKFWRNALRRQPPPPQERRLSGGRHSKMRDAEAIEHHYDVSNTFYRWVLGPSLAYTCAVFPNADASLEEAQEAKFDLVCQKLALKPGMRLLDVGCGWGGMVLHAVRNYGVKAIGVTLSEQQAIWGQHAIKEAGLEDVADIRFSDYRDVEETDFDAISAIGITEHIGRQNYDSYFSFLYGKVRPQGRMLNHTITRSADIERSHYDAGFINRYVFPDGELSGPSTVQMAMNSAGFEIRHEENLRDHYALTLKHWCDNLEEHWDEAVAEAGEGTARVWRLYMAASRVGFEVNNIQLHQALGVKVDDRGGSGFPLRPAY